MRPTELAIVRFREAISAAKEAQSNIVKGAGDPNSHMYHGIAIMKVGEAIMDLSNGMVELSNGLRATYILLEQVQHALQSQSRHV